MNNKVLYYIGVKTIKSMDKKKILANIQINKKLIETIIGNFTLADLDISQRSYILKLNNNIIAKITRKHHFMRNQYIVEMNNISEQYQVFIFALIILINSALERLQDPLIYPYSINYNRISKFDFE